MCTGPAILSTSSLTVLVLAHWFLNLSISASPGGLGKPSLLGPTLVVQWLYPVWLFVASWATAHQASLTFTNSQSLLKLMTIESVMPSNHLTFWWKVLDMGLEGNLQRPQVPVLVMPHLAFPFFQLCIVFLDKFYEPDTNWASHCLPVFQAWSSPQSNHLNTKVPSNKS